jgi:hypothetical protein
MTSIDFLIVEKALERINLSINLSEYKSSFGNNIDPQEFKSILLNFLSDNLRLPNIENSIRQSEMRLRVALHFACPSAIVFDNGKTTLTRWGIIKKYILNNFTFTEEEAEKVSRLVAKVLDDWDISRKRGLQNNKFKLLENQKYLCACCHLSFSDKDRITLEESLALSESSDPYKPYFDETSLDSMLPQVDHKTVVSKDGTNQTDNLQVLCGLCNLGKGANSGIRPSKELEYGHLPIADIPRSHRMNLIYYRIMMDNCICNNCKSNINELSIRKIHDEGLIVLTNLQAVCYQCIQK